MSAQPTPPKAGSRRSAAAPRWSSTTALVYAASGAAIGFNNIWQFPSLVTGHGGGAFLVLYVLGLAVLGAPLLAGELLLGRRAQLSPASGFYRLAQHTRSDPYWGLVGWMATLTGFLILSYLGVIAGWTIAFLVRASLGVLSGQTAEGLASLFTAVVQDPEKQLFWFTLFVAATGAVAARGVRAGLERLAWVALPVMLALLVLLFAYSATTPTFLDAAVQVLAPDFERLGTGSLLTAVGHVFFSLGLGAGVMLAYGAYAAEDVSIPRVVLGVAALDTAVGVVAAVALTALLAAGGVEPATGPALVFQAVPLALDHLPLGSWLVPLFFLLLALAAWLSAVALLEPLVAWLTERFALARARAALAAATGAWALGVVMMLSFNHWAFEFRFFDTVKKLGLFDATQILTSHVLLPLTGLFVALFAGWRLRADEARAQFAFRSPCTFDAWLWLTRLVVPLLLAVLILSLPELLA